MESLSNTLSLLGYDLLSFATVNYSLSDEEQVPPDCYGGSCDGGCSSGCSSCSPGCNAGGAPGR